MVSLSSCRVDRMEKLKKQVDEILQKEKGTFAVAFKDLGTGETLMINERISFHAASTMKTPVMIEVYKQASEGKFSLTDSILIKNEFKSIVDGSPYSLSPEDDSDQELYAYIGRYMSIRDLMYRMIIVSSNLATNLIIELVDAKKVTETMRAMGANDIQVLRGVEDSKAFEKGLINRTSAYDLMLLLEKIATGTVIDEASSNDMIEILLQQKFKEIIPARLPKEVKVAHKTGTITGVRHDCGIVFLPDGRKYVLVLLSKELENADAGIDAMSRVSEKIYQSLVEGV